MNYDFLNSIYHKALNEILKRLPQHLVKDDVGNVAHLVTDYIYNEINYQYLVPYGHKDSFEEFLKDIVVRQCMPTVDPLVCAMVSSHNLLVPRITLLGEKYLVCPSCGYVQVPVPESLYKLAKTNDETTPIKKNI